MKITVERAALLRTIRTVVIAADENPRLDVFRFVRLSAAGNIVTLTTASRTLSAEKGVAADVTENGEFAVPVAVLADVLSALNPGTAAVSLETRGDSMYIRCADKAKTMRINGMAEEHIPARAESTGTQTHRVNVSVTDVRSLLRATVHATAGEREYGWRNSVCLARDGESLVAIATDGIKSGYRAVPTTTRYPDFGEVLLPAEAVERLLRILPRDGQGEFAFPADRAGTGRRLFFETEDGLVVSVCLTEAKFPDWRKNVSTRIQEQKERLFAVKREELSGLVSRMKHFQSYGSIGLEGDTLTGVAIGQNGTFNGEINLSTIRGSTPAEAIVLDLHYLSNALEALQSEWIGLSMATTTVPVTLCQMTGNNIPDTNSIQAISPMRPR